MSELGDLLELMHGARDRWRTVRATIRTWRHLERHGAAWHAWGEAQSGRRGRSVTFYGVVNEDAEPDPETSESRTRLWIDDDRVREEHDGDPYPHLAVGVGDLWWRYDEHNGAISNEDAREIGSGIGDEFRYLFDPASLIGGLRFEPLGPTQVAGRNGIRARAVARETDDLDFDLRHLPRGANEYELVVDEKRGILLGLAARFQGDDFLVAELLEVDFDEEFPPETFVFEPPQGEEVRSASARGLPKQVSIEEAQGQAPFTVWIPRKLDPDWEMHVYWMAPKERPATPAGVSIHYVRQNVSHQFSLHENAVGEQDDFTATWEPRERGDEQILVWHDARGRETGVRVERDGTQITIHSQNMELEQLLALVDLLVPAPTDPPQLA